MRSASCVQMRRLSSTVRVAQPAISSKLRQHPSHHCVRSDMRHTDTQGEGTSCAVATVCAFFNKRSTAGVKRTGSGRGDFSDMGEGLSG